MSDTPTPNPEFAGPGEWKAQSEPEQGEFRGPGEWKARANEVEAPSSVWDMEDE
jgi:hypothetical protein